jgi:hypothetical protein
MFSQMYEIKMKVQNNHPCLLGIGLPMHVLSYLPCKKDNKVGCKGEVSPFFRNFATIKTKRQTSLFAIYFNRI